MPTIDFLQAATEGARTGIAIGSYLRETGRQADQNFATQYALGQAGVESILRAGQMVVKQNQLKMDNQIRQRQMAQEDLRIGQAQARIDQQTTEDNRRASLDQLKYNAQLFNQNADNRRADAQLGLSVAGYNQKVAEANRELQQERYMNDVFGIPNTPSQSNDIGAYTPEQATRPDAVDPANPYLPPPPSFGGSARPQFGEPDNTPMSAGLLGDSPTVDPDAGSFRGEPILPEDPAPSSIGRAVDTSTLPPPPFGSAAPRAATDALDTALAASIGRSQNSVADARKLSARELDKAEVGAAKLTALAGTDDARQAIARGAVEAVENVKRQRLAEAKAKEVTDGEPTAAAQARDKKNASLLSGYMKDAIRQKEKAYPGTDFILALESALVYEKPNSLAPVDEEKASLKLIAKDIKSSAEALGLTWRQAVEQYQAGTLKSTAVAAPDFQNFGAAPAVAPTDRISAANEPSGPLKSILDRIGSRKK